MASLFRVALVAFAILFFDACAATCAEPPSKAAAAVAEFDAQIKTMQDEFARIPADARDKAWVQKKLQHMVDTDQYMRSFILPDTRELSQQEQQEIMDRWLKLDRQNTDDLKVLLKTYDWFTISQFGKQADGNAWLLVQHADHDAPFQQQILAKLEKLYPAGETSPRNYAYLHDRLAASWHDPAKRRPQRYGTQGMCTAPGKWEPLTLEDPANVDERRAAVGLPPLAEYIAGFKDICKNQVTTVENNKHAK